MLDMLTVEQRLGATEEGHTVIAAVPGSGKTRVMVAKTEYMLDRYPEARICCVTFTRDSANEMRERTLKALSPGQEKRVAFGTFHSLCLVQLKRAGIRMPIITNAHRTQLLLRAASLAEAEGTSLEKQTAPNAPPRESKSGIEKAPRLGLDDIAAMVEGIKGGFTMLAAVRPVAVAITAKYQDLMERNRVCDFQDIIIRAVEGMRTGKVQPISAHFMLVDEFQDTDALQYEWVKAHIQAGTRVTVVADDDQSIYGWRGALGYPGMKQFEEDHGAKLITLTLNYRSRAEILDLAERVINCNKQRIDKRLRSFQGPGGSVEYRAYGGAEEEAMAIYQEVFASPNTWAILSRNNMALDIVEARLTAQQVPFTRTGGSLWDVTAVTQLITVLTWFADGSAPKGSVDAVLSWAGVNEDDLAELHSIIGENLSELPAKMPRLPQRAREMLQTLALSLDHAKIARTAESQIESALAWVIGEAKEQHHKVLHAAALALKGLNGTLKQRLAFIRHSSSRDDEPAGVRLYTMHGSKGLEFDNVWMMHCQQQVIPGEAGNQAEERRLFYVGMTRARHNLIISGVGAHSLFVEEAFGSQSKDIASGRGARYPARRIAA